MIITSAEDILDFIKDKIPMIYDLDKEDLVYNKRNPYYKIYKYITTKEKTIEKALEWLKNNVYYLEDGKEFIENVNPEELFEILKEGK